MSWIERLFVAALGANVVLILAGLAIVPSTLRSPIGIVSALGAIAMQIALAAVALAGPFSLRRWRHGAGISFALGLLLAVVYLAIILAEFLGVRDTITILTLFVGAALVAGFVAGYRARQWRQGVMAGIWALVIGTALWSIGDQAINYAFWGSHQQYAFMLYDGAVDDFHRSGGGDFSAFLLQDMQGALFFHQALSVVVGALCGIVGGGLAQGAILLQRRSVSAP